MSLSRCRTELLLLDMPKDDQLDSVASQKYFQQFQSSPQTDLGATNITALKV